MRTLIRFVESRPDTFVTLTSNERVIVKEPVAEVVRRVIAYSRAVRSLPTSSDRAVASLPAALRPLGRSCRPVPHGAIAWSGESGWFRRPSAPVRSARTALKRTCSKRSSHSQADCSASTACHGDFSAPADGLVRCGIIRANA